MPTYDLGLEHVSLAFATKNIFNDVTQGVFEGDRIGIVGKNGDGKSTLLHLFRGAQEPDSGRVTKRGGLTFGMLDQRDPLDDNATIRDAALEGRADYEWASDNTSREIVEALLGGMSLDAKVAYTFLLNRFQLSRRNGWINEHGEVFVIFPRKALAKELRICEQRVTAAFKKLVELKLVWEKRCGRGDANQIYLARVTPMEDPDYSCAPFELPEEKPDCGSRTADFEGLAAADTPAANQEPQNPQSKNHGNCDSRAADPVPPEPQKPTPSKKEKRDTDLSHIEVSQSVSARSRDGRTDEEIEEELLDILDGCELYCFEPETALVFENAIERLFYADSFRIGNATLPQCRVRAKLKRLDGMILRDVESKLHANQDRAVKNSTAYTMAVLFNCIAESESDLMIDPYLNAICATA